MMLKGVGTTMTLTSAKRTWFMIGEVCLKQVGFLTWGGLEGNPLMRMFRARKAWLKGLGFLTGGGPEETHCKRSMDFGYAFCHYRSIS